MRQTDDERYRSGGPGGDAGTEGRAAAGEGQGGAGCRRRPWGCLVVLALLAGLLYVGRPWLERAVRVAKLTAAPVPTSLPVPVDGVRLERLTDTWGAARSDGRSHEGIDIFAPRGTAVRSTTRGLIVRRGENSLGGRIVTVLGPGRQFHYYAHLDEWGPVAAGDWVEPGALLGEVGNSGNAAGTPPHLHYGIYEAGGAINPYPLLAAP
jgi:murein DD-endopeptidase MepM/ murein hydrolase activator NlpD